MRSKKPKRTRPMTLEELDAPTSSAACLAMLVGDDYWHGHIRRILAAAGFETRRLEREEAHPIWQAWLTRTTYALADDARTARRQLLFVLRRGGLQIAQDELTILHRSGDKLRCSFTLDLGKPGVLQPRPFQKGRQTEFLPPQY